MTDSELIQEIEEQKSLMIAVSTGGPQIQEVNKDYRNRRQRIKIALQGRGIEDPNFYTDLWRWYGKWSSGDLPTYRSRREYISDLYDSLIDLLQNRQQSARTEIFDETTGWSRVDRTIESYREKLETAQNEEDYQTVGLLCRETLISLAQAVYNSKIHTSIDDIQPGETDARRMLESYISTELSSGSNEEARKHAKASLSLANSLVHKRTANFRDAALCAEATTSIVNIIAIISGKRDPD